MADYRRLDARDPVSGYAALSFDNRRLTPGLERNLLGDPADQPVSIYVPDLCARRGRARTETAFSRNLLSYGYVIVFLHGYADPSSSTGMMDRSIASQRYSG